MSNKESMMADEVETYDETEYDEPVEDEPGEIIDTNTLDTLDDVHAAAAYNRAVMGPAASDPTIATPGTDPDPEPGPGPEDNEKLDNATGGALSNAAESGPAAALRPDVEGTGVLQANQNLGIGVAEGEHPGTAAVVGGTGEVTEVPEGEVPPGEVEQVESDYDPGMYTVAEVQAYIAEHPEEEDAILDAERAGKNRAGLVG